MSRIIFLLEEYSMEVFLKGIIPRLFPDLDFLCISHDGKQDLEKSIPRKLRAWNIPGDMFIILIDNDCSDCIELKARLLRSCPEHNICNTKVRIVCQELEAWYFGEPEAIANAYERPNLRGINKKRRYRDPDAITQPSRELERLIPDFQKVSGARILSTRISRDMNNSKSFQVLCEGIERLSRRLAEKDSDYLP